jgi:hypothetical protein
MKITHRGRGHRALGPWFMRRPGDVCAGRDSEWDRCSAFSHRRHCSRGFTGQPLREGAATFAADGAGFPTVSPGGGEGKVGLARVAPRSSPGGSAQRTARFLRKPAVLRPSPCRDLSPRATSSTWGRGWRGRAAYPAPDPARPAEVSIGRLTSHRACRIGFRSPAPMFGRARCEGSLTTLRGTVSLRLPGPVVVAALRTLPHVRPSHGSDARTVIAARAERSARVIDRRLGGGGAAARRPPPGGGYGMVD